MALLLAGGAATVRGQSALDGFDPNANALVRAVVVQPDGKILIGGSFTTLAPDGGAPVARNRIARLNSNGTLDTNFNPSANASVFAIALQDDGKVLIGGDFTRLTNSIGATVTRNRIARLDAITGEVDSFNPNANSSVLSIVVLTNGNILAGGNFSTNGGAARRYIAKLDATTGAADPMFNPNSGGTISTIAVQRDGRVLVGGAFTSIGGQLRGHIARLDALTGAPELFNPNADQSVYAITVQVDGKILAGGDFSTIGGQARNLLARLDPTTGLADSFNPAATDLTVRSIAVQADGKVLVGGIFTTFGGQARTNMARLDPTTGSADSFAPDPDGLVYSIAVQADGRILAGGMFTTLVPNGGDTVTRNYLARFAAPPPRLNIQRSANTDVVLSWATNFTGFTLEVSTNFNPNVWSVVSPAPAASGTNNVVTNTISGSARFYWLRN